MTCAVVYSSRTGNTRELAGTLRSCISQKELLYFGGPDEAALQAERICAGFWTDKGNCDGEMKEFLGELYGKVRIENHDAFSEDKLVYLGDTSRKTPVKVNKTVYESRYKKGAVYNDGG